MSVALKKNHQQVKRQMRADVANGENRAFQFLVREAQVNAPKRTGFLARSVEQQLEATAERPTAHAHVGASYGVPVDQGTYKTAGTFFWTRAVLAMYDKVEQFFRRR